MSRYSRDDDRANEVERFLHREPLRSHKVRNNDLDEDHLTRGLALPHGDEREIVAFRDREYSLNGSEARALAAVGAFRAVDVSDLEHGADAFHGDWRSLREQGLLTHETLTDRNGARHVVALTRDGKDLLDTHAASRSDGRQQAYYAGIVKPRELAHDARLYGAYKEEAARIEREGGRVTRVVLDYELKRDYQKFLNRDDRPDDATLDRDRATFAAVNDLKVIHGHLELPDLRIEYVDEDGRLEHRDVELLTEHYSRGQLAGKSRAGFTCYRAAGRRGGGQSRRGDTPFDPRILERL